jgi:MEKK4 N-terminal
VLQNAAINLRQNVANAISLVDEKLNIDDLSEMDESEKVNVLTLFRETLHQCYNFGFEVFESVPVFLFINLLCRMHEITV